MPTNLPLVGLGIWIHFDIIFSLFWTFFLRSRWTVKLSHWWVYCLDTEIGEQNTLNIMNWCNFTILLILSDTFDYNIQHIVVTCEWFQFFDHWWTLSFNDHFRGSFKKLKRRQITMSCFKMHVNVALMIFSISFEQSTILYHF